MANGYIHEEHVIFRKTLRKFLEKEAYSYFGQWEKERQVPRKFWTKMGQNGFLCPWIEEKYGGYGADFAYSVILNEKLERVGQA
ncbi:acyl-CoA dehydrogenase [Halalkalibacter nanhaiisediminis]|uniref:Acyl-CoA dehydrogenase n=1 Tax=Halalkalibacter nanhaiisediminis TaxID=688079 RepID=A0A562QH81_9BACI|nr:acyl-CoA dehydrogenase [Halalkalibacter nanhaiisediminis]